jgi:ABC-type sugar transport system ATPase subunit
MRVQMRKELCQLHQRLQSTMIYVTHDQVEAMTMGDRIVVIKDGRIQQIGTPMEIYRKPANEFVAGFIGSPPMNFIECEVRDRGLIVNNAPVAVPASSLARLRSVGVRKVKLGVRPEDLAMQPIEGGFSLEGSVDLNELLGSEMLVYLSAGASLSFIAKLLNGNPLPAGEAVRFYAPWESLYYFDAATGRAL